MAQKYVLVHFIASANVPNEFVVSEWPLHITLLANFRMPQLDELKNELAVFAKQTKPFDIPADGEALFGPNQNVRVSLLRPDKSIIAVHGGLLSIASKLGAVFDEPNFTGSGFRPHATQQAKSSLQDNEMVHVADFTLVDMYPNNDISRRRIIETYKLGN